MQPIKTIPGALGAILLAAGAAPASAQSGSAPPPAGAAATAPAEVLRAAACEIARSANAGNALLATAPFSAEERTQAGNLARAAQRCLRLTAPIATTAYNFRGAIAEAVYENRFATPVAARTPALGAKPLPRPAAGAEAQIAEILAPMYALVDCATPRQPDLARALMATEPRSAEETAALTAFNATFTACVPLGTQLRIDPRVMRNFFAEALYRWSVVQRDGPTSPWAAPPAPAAPAAAPAPAPQ
jgi:hypothetical protein